MESHLFGNSLKQIASRYQNRSSTQAAEEVPLLRV